MADLQGGLTLLFTDIEGSTVLLRELKGSYGLLLRVHQRMLERSFDDHHGRPMSSESSTTAGQKAFDSGCGSASTADR
jgi:class 3 adenylate cyclase